MNIENHLQALFPLLSDIPERIKLKAPIHQKQILINGELTEWNGSSHLVFSPVYIKYEGDGPEKPFVIGSYPLGTTTEAVLTLGAAEAAYNSGRGEWPSMPLQQRIKSIASNFSLSIDLLTELLKLCGLYPNL